MRYLCPFLWLISSTVTSFCTSGNELLVEMSGSGGVGEASAAGGFDLVVEWDRELAVPGAAGGELALFDPDVDDVIADVEALREFVDAEFVVVEW